jgi:glycosyltransferase involved in cell wall biosynthesis
LPVLATDISGVPELVRPGVTGYLAKAADPVDLAEQLAEIYQNPEHATQLAAEGRQLVLREFVLSSNVEHLAKYFESCL